MDFPKMREWWGKFEVSAKTLKARLMRKSFLQEVEVVFDDPARWCANIQALPPATFLTAYIDVHVLL
jgi:hypothetical protein